MHAPIENSAALPDWALGVLCNPGEGEGLELREGRLRTGSGREVRVDRGVVFLAGASADEISSHEDRFPLARRKSPELLKPGQIRFRRLLEGFLSRLAPGAIVVDIASADAEFHQLYSRLRYIPMDLSVEHLRRAYELGRVQFGVVANIAAAPIRPASVDAIVSTNTLQHLPLESVAEVVRNLLCALRPGGRAAITLRTERLQRVLDGLRGTPNRITRVVPFDGPLSEAWRRGVVRPMLRLRAKSAPLAWSELLAGSLNSVASVAGELEASVLAKLQPTWRQNWIEIERS